jgi:hypothetical protein
MFSLPEEGLFLKNGLRRRHCAVISELGNVITLKLQLALAVATVKFLSPCLMCWAQCHTH